MKYYLVQGHLLRRGSKDCWIVRGPVKYQPELGWERWEVIRKSTSTWQHFNIGVRGEGGGVPSGWRHAVEITEMESKVFIENLI